MTKIKILHIIKSLGRGGAEMLLPETLKLHDKDRFEFHYIYFLPWKNQMEESIQHGGGKVTCLAANNNLQLLLKYNSVKKYIKDNKIQLIHAHLPWAGILARMVGYICKIPVFYTEHNKQERYHAATRILNLLTLNYLTTLIAVSQDVADSVHKHKANLKIPIRVILNGVNTDSFNPRHFAKEQIREKFRIPAEACIIGTIAVFRFQKRLDLWMELVAKILKHNANVHFIIVGDGPLKEKLYKKREDLGLQDKIHMPGLETEIRPYLACFDIYMMSSVFEGLPIALLEAMSMECAVITTDAGGIKEVIRHETDGLMCPVETPEKLVEFATQLLVDDSLRLKYREQARRRIIESFSLRKMVTELEETYYEISGN